MEAPFLEGIDEWEDLLVEGICKDDIWEEVKYEEEAICEEETCEAISLLHIGQAVLEVLLYKKWVITYRLLVLELLVQEEVGVMEAVFDVERLL